MNFCVFVLVQAVRKAKSQVWEESKLIIYKVPMGRLLRNKIKMQVKLWIFQLQRNECVSLVCALVRYISRGHTPHIL